MVFNTIQVTNNEDLDKIDKITDLVTFPGTYLEILLRCAKFMNIQQEINVYFALNTDGQSVNIQSIHPINLNTTVCLRSTVVTSSYKCYTRGNNQYASGKHIIGLSKLCNNDTGTTRIIGDIAIKFGRFKKGHRNLSHENLKFNGCSFKKQVIIISRMLKCKKCLICVNDALDDLESLEKFISNFFTAINNMVLQSYVMPTEELTEESIWRETLDFEEVKYDGYGVAHDERNREHQDEFENQFDYPALNQELEIVEVAHQGTLPEMKNDLEIANAEFVELRLNMTTGETADQAADNVHLENLIKMETELEEGQRADYTACSEQLEAAENQEKLSEVKTKLLETKTKLEAAENNLKRVEVACKEEIAKVHESLKKAEEECEKEKANLAEFMTNQQREITELQRHHEDSQKKWNKELDELKVKLADNEKHLPTTNNGGGRKRKVETEPKFEDVDDCFIDCDFDEAPYWWNSQLKAPKKLVMSVIQMEKFVNKNIIPPHILSWVGIEHVKFEGLNKAPILNIWKKLDCPHVFETNFVVAYLEPCDSESYIRGIYLEHFENDLLMFLETNPQSDPGVFYLRRVPAHSVRCKMCHHRRANNKK